MINNVKRKGNGYIFDYKNDSHTIKTIKVFREYDEKLAIFDTLASEITSSTEEKISEVSIKNDKEVSFIISSTEPSDDRDKLVSQLTTERQKSIKKLEVKKGNDLYKNDIGRDIYIDSVQESAIGALYIFLRNDGDVGTHVNTPKERKAQLRKECTAFIYNSYSLEKQSQDSNSNSICRTNILALIQNSNRNTDGADSELLPYTNLELVVESAVNDILAGALYDDIATTIPETIRKCVSKMIRIAVRRVWLNNCKDELARALVDGDSPTYQNFIII